MIQKLVLSALLLGAAGATQAQNRSLKMLHLNPQQQKQFNLVNSLVQKNPRSGSIAHKPTAIKQRVVSQVFFEDGSIDSSRYHYSGTNGSSYNFNNFVDPGYSYAFGPDIAPAYANFDERLPSTDVHADSISSLGDGMVYARHIAYYNAAGLLDSAIEKEVPSGDIYSKVLVQRNAAGHVTSVDEVGGAGSGSWGQRKRIIYNTSGQVTTDSSFYISGGTWSYNNSRTYHYNGSGRLDTLMESNGSFYKTRHLFSYDGTGRLIATRAYSIVEDSPAILMTKDSVGYTEGHDYITYYEDTYYGEMGEDESYRLLQYAGSHPGPDSMKIQFSAEGGEWFTLTTGRFEYNLQGNPVALYAENMDPEEDDQHIKFYYEDYDDGLSNKDVFLNKDFAVYPNPFTNNISLEYKGTEQKNVSVSLADITGRTVFQSSINLQSGSNNIAVPELSAGTYILQVQGKTGKLYSNKLIKK